MASFVASVMNFAAATCPLKLFFFDRTLGSYVIHSACIHTAWSCDGRKWIDMTEKY